MNNIIKFGANRVWRTYQGGKQLDIMEGKKSPQDSSFPEDWIGSTVEARNVGREGISEGLASVSNDQGERLLFRDLILFHQAALLGGSRSSPRLLEDMPLVKYLDSSTRLHFQVHPTREFAQKRLGRSRGKTEAYVILAIRDDVTEPYIYAGFQRPPTREQLHAWIEDQDIDSIEGCFDKIPVKPGDVFLIPGGRPHAIGEGILLLEIMEPSDLAVRFEFERCGYRIPEEARFMGQDIHTALDVFNLNPVPMNSIEQEFHCKPFLIAEEDGNKLEQLISPSDTSCFTVKRATVGSRLIREEKTFFLGIVIEGEGSFRAGETVVKLKQWDRFFCPANLVFFGYESNRGMTVIECYPGGEGVARVETKKSEAQ